MTQLSNIFFDFGIRLQRKQKVLIGPKKIFFLIKIGIIKRKLFWGVRIHWKECKTFTPKNNWLKTFAHSNNSQNFIVLSLFLPITFWRKLFFIFFCGFEISIKFCVFDTHIEFIKNTGIKTAQKIKKRFWKLFLELHLHLLTAWENQVVKIVVP